MTTLELMERLLGNAEIGRLLGVSRQRVGQLTTRPDFPRPRAILSMGSVWSLTDLQQWADSTGRALNIDALGPDPLDANT